MAIVLKAYSWIKKRKKYCPALISAAKAEYPSMKILVRSGYADLNFAIEVATRGADDFMTMPFDMINLVAVLRRIIRV